MKTNIKMLIMATAVIMLMGSCKKWLDVNENPNNLPIDQGTVDLALTSAEYQLAYVVGNKYAQIGGFLSQYWTQKPSATQYYDYDRYAFDASDIDREWSQMYAGVLRDLQFVAEKSEEAADSNYLGVAKVLMAYTFQVQTDLHGDIPFSEALKGGDNITPKYDAQQDVYNGILTLLNEATVLFDNQMTTHPEGDDVIFGGDMSMWWKFANSLKLKVLMRQSEVRPGTASSGIAAMSGLSASDFLEAGEMAEIAFYSAAGNQNPLYASTQSIGDNNVASTTITTVLNALGDSVPDPRTDIFFAASPARGTPQGAAAAGGYPANAATSAPGANMYAATTPVILMSGHECLFLQAEAKVRGWMAGGASAAQTDYEDAINSNLDYYSAASVDFGAVEYAFPTTNATDQINMIAMHKWVSMCGNQNLEAWCELRRLNFPVLTPSAASQLGAGNLPARIPYPAGEETSNPKFPGQKAITLKMWWDN